MRCRFIRLGVVQEAGCSMCMAFGVRVGALGEWEIAGSYGRCARMVVTDVL